MYKNVLNQRMIALFLLFSSCFLTVTARALSKRSTPPQILANASVKTVNISRHSTYQIIKSIYFSETDVSYKHHALRG